MTRRDVVTRPVDFRHGTTALNGVLVTADGNDTAAPTVLVFPGWEGRGDGQIAIAKRIVSLGYQAFAVDLYGNGAGGSTPAECEALMRPFMDDRDFLAARLSAVLDGAAALPEVDAKRIVAIGFCFGGLCVLDLARSGADIVGVASFHGVLTTPPGRTGGAIGCKVAVYHGWDDPLAPPDDVVALAAELTAAGADWQFQAFGHTLHAFMAPTANAPEQGIMYNPRSARRAWQAFELFLQDCFAD